MSTYPLNISQAADLVDISIQAIYGWEKPDAVRSSIDEYMLYNRNRDAQYAAEDASYRMKMRLLSGALIIVLAWAIISITL